MIKIVELTKQGIGRLANSEPFLMPDKLDLQFLCEGYNLENAFITLINGTVIDKVKLTNPFTVPEALLFGGKLSMIIKAYEGKIPVKTWTVMPLTIVETETGKEVQDYVYTLEKRIEELEENVERLNRQHQIIQ